MGGDEAYALWAVELQNRQNELFWDEKNGGYFASAVDDHVLVRMKETQVSSHLSARVVTLISSRTAPNRQQLRYPYTISLA